MEAHVFYVAGFVQADEAIGEAFHLAFQKNEAMIGGFPGNSFVFVELEEGGSVFEFAALALDAVGLDFAKLVQAFLELAGETLALDAEVGEEAMGVDDVKGDFLIERNGGGCTREHVGFEEWDAVETPGGVGELVDKMGFGGSSGLVFVEEAAAMRVVRGSVFGGEDGGRGR